MKTCPNCGIRFENEDGKCPLCEKDGSALEIRKTAAFTREFYWRLYLIISSVALLIIIVIDLVYSPGLSWSIIPLISVLYIWLSLLLIIKLRLRSFLLLWLESLATLIMLILLDRFIPGRPWFMGFALPAMITSYILFNFTIYIFKITHLTILLRTALNVIIAGICLISLELFLDNYKQDTIALSWSLIAFAGILPLSFFLIYLDKKIKRSGEELKKYFHF
ncbi:MAG: DUF6320 domain-containing protein [Candidatus Stygibacter australis]|nr:DUF6320 domain-containing protein [Candidatus Stygibacter australis]